jgi:hypothetical protein
MLSSASGTTSLQTSDASSDERHDHAVVTNISKKMIGVFQKGHQDRRRADI